MKARILRLLVLVSVAAALAAACSSGVAPDARDKKPSSAAKPVSKPVVVVLDGSESMLTSDAPGPRIDAAKAAVQSFVSELPAGTPFGLVTYGTSKPAKTTPQAEGCTDVTTVLDVSPVDKTRVATAVAGVNAAGWTPLAQAMRQGASLLGSGGTVIVVSDGESTCAPDPCPTAATITAQNPDITISTVGFKSSAEQLSCVAKSGNGVFLTADNAAQLATRLGVSRDPSAASEKLSSNGVYGIDLGAELGDVRASASSFPSAPAGAGSTFTVRWRECDFTFTDSVLTDITISTRAVSTVDNVGVGTPMSRVIELYGEPVRDDEATRTAYFAADAPRGLALKVRYGTDVRAGEVTAITLCRCLPTPERSNVASNCGPTADFPQERVFADGVSCEVALRLIESWYQDPRTRSGDKTVMVGAWSCSIQGAAEVDSGDPVVRCDRAYDKAQVTIGPPPQASVAAEPGGRCTGYVEQRAGTVTILAGSVSCDDAQQLLRQRDGNVGYFQRQNGDAWACASDDVSVKYECYAVNGPDRFRWEAR